MNTELQKITDACLDRIIDIADYPLLARQDDQNEIEQLQTEADRLKSRLENDQIQENRRSKETYIRMSGSPLQQVLIEQLRDEDNPERKDKETWVKNPEERRFLLQTLQQAECVACVQKQIPQRLISRAYESRQLWEKIGKMPPSEIKAVKRRLQEIMERIRVLSASDRRPEDRIDEQIEYLANYLYRYPDCLQQEVSIQANRIMKKYSKRLQSFKPRHPKWYTDAVIEEIALLIEEDLDVSAIEEQRWLDPCSVEIDFDEEKIDGKPFDPYSWEHFYADDIAAALLEEEIVLSEICDEFSAVPALLENEIISYAQQILQPAEEMEWIVSKIQEQLKDTLWDEYIGAGFYDENIQKKLEAAIQRNSYITDTKKERREQERKERQQIRDFEASLARLNESYPSLFPKARALRRHFIIHAGPTNSGKTHAALQALLQAEDGMYLAPLRLLAAENAQYLTEHGKNCSLLTGEERNLIPNAAYLSSTIEMLDLRKRCTVAVIDEGQMVEDRQRGGAWTRAIVGLACETIHICCTPDAVSLITQLIEWCKDSWELVEHERKAQLIYLTDENDDASFSFEDLQKGDAVIVFSRNRVHALAYEINQHDHNCAILYGALPYQVKAEQARRFGQGICDILVATDCIGMGMNLPIRRVLFFETSKYNGEYVTELTDKEIRQIAGRAGRFGQYETGYCGFAGRKLTVRKAEQLTGQSEDIEHYTLGFDSSLIPEGCRYSEALRLWEESDPGPKARKQDMSQARQNAVEIEEACPDCPLEDVILLADLAFKRKNPEELANWKAVVQYHLKSTGQPLAVQTGFQSNSLESLETLHACYDLWSEYFFRINDPQAERYQNAKLAVSMQINARLAQKAIEQRSCRRCGEPLAWNYPYGICQDCYEAGRTRRFWDDDFWDDDF